MTTPLISVLVSGLEQVYTQKGVSLWLNAKNRQLSGKRPIELLVDDRIDEVWDAVQRLRSGAN